MRAHEISDARIISWCIPCGRNFFNGNAFRVNTPQVQNAAPHQTAEHQTSNKINENGDNVQSLWVPIDSVGLYTLVLAVFTGLLVGVSGVQG